MEKDTVTEEKLSPTTSSHDDVGEKTADTSAKVSVMVLEQYGREEGDITPGMRFIMDKVSEMSDSEAVAILKKTIHQHSGDPNFMLTTMDRLKRLVAETPHDDWSLEVRTEAAICHYHSPYPEVRSVTDPFDDTAIPVETIRSYFLGLIFMAGGTALNTFFSPRQPGISIGTNVLQLLLAPCGQLLAKILPDWGFRFRGRRISLNPGPWSYKEQMFATIMFRVAHGAGATYYVYLVQKLPQYLNQSWVSYPYEILLALTTQFFGFGVAGILRRFVIFPVTALWPQVLPTLALNRALVNKEKVETVNGWRITRYRFFLAAFCLMFIYFWIPNFLFQALRLFNWMTWIAPENFALGMITGSYGGMGFNPWATFDWNVSGTGSLVTPFFSQFQQYIARVISGLIIIGMYWGNYVWSAYMPINSNEAFANDGTIYNVTRVAGEHGKIDLERYKEYGPPYFSGANVFGQGAWFAWYPLTLLYYSFKHSRALKKGLYDFWQSIRHGRSIYANNNDAHTRMIRKYKEVPEWWFLAILLTSSACGIAAVSAWPTYTPWWSIIVVILISLIFLIPATIMTAVANVGMGLNVLFMMLAGVWFAGNPVAQIIVTAVGGAFTAQADNYVSDQKLGHYAKLPPRSIFRGQMISVLCNTFIFISILDWMVTSFNDGTLCTWTNKAHFVCTDAVLVFASAVEYGAFGVKNLFQLYPIMPWCFLMGAVVGLAFGVLHRYGASIRSLASRRLSARTYSIADKLVFSPLAYLHWFDPAVFWAGALNWTGGNNLSYATNGLYLAFIFMYYIKRRYPAWWEKYNYILSAGFDVGVAVSGIIMTLAFNFGHEVTLDWWGNNVAQAGVDFQAYKQNATLLPIPEVGYFGLTPEQYPTDW